MHETPLTTSTFINEQTRKSVYFKMENQQKTGAFKIRGASYKISQLTKQQLQNGVITASAGNHAQGVALAAAKRGGAATIYMPERTPEAKVSATKAYGATIVKTGGSFQEAYEAARAEQATTNKMFIHPFDDIDVMAGQGTIAIEMLEQNPNLQTILVPIGGGGLISGIAFAAKWRKPSIQIIGVQAERASATYNRFYGINQKSLQQVDTIADGIAVKQPGIATFPYIQRYVDTIITVTETDIANAMLYMLERHKSLVEGAGATALAGLLAHHRHINTHNIGIVISGGNMDVSKLPMIQQLKEQPKIIQYA
nr:threonine/serine dehydratase [Pontibacillus litoralis]